MKKLINDVQDVLDEQLAGLAKAHPSLTLHQDPVYVTELMPPLQESCPAVGWRQRTRADALWLYRSGDAFGGLSGRNFHLTDAR